MSIAFFIAASVCAFVFLMMAIGASMGSFDKKTPIVSIGILAALLYWLAFKTLG